MRRYLLLLIFVLSFCFAANAQARKLALLVGVDEYEDIQSLKCCVNDMKTLKEALMKIGFREDNIQILVTGNAYKNIPTKKKIEQKLSEILSMAQPNDLVFIAFSGHGAQNGKNVYFCPPDTDLNDLDGTCVSITKVMDDLANCKAKFKWMVVDACRNDPTSTRAAKGLQVVPAPPSGIALFQSCAKGELSYEEKRAGGNGYFTKNFAAALSGEADANHDGRLTLFEVCDWTADHTKSDVLKAENATQRPYFSGSIPNFVLTEDLNVPKAKKLAAEARDALDEENYELAIKKYNEALALRPNYNPWERDLKLAQKLLKQKDESEYKPKYTQTIDEEISASVPDLPKNGSAADYLKYVQASSDAMNNALQTLQVSAQANGEQLSPKKAQALAATFMEKNLEAVNRGLEDPYASEIVFQKLALAKAELLSLKIKLHNDQAAKEELKSFLDKLQKDGKDTTLKLVATRINAIDAQINAQIFRARLIKAVNTQNAEEIGKLVKEMDEALKNADYGKNATPEMAQNAMMLMFLVQKVPNYRPSEELIPKYLNILSNATNPETIKVVDNVKQQIADAIKAAKEKQK